MTDIYQKNGQEICFKTSPAGFMIVLPNLNYLKETNISRSKKTDMQVDLSSLADQRAKLALDIIRANGPVSRMELENSWGINRSAAGLTLDQLVRTGVLLRIGKGRNTKYIEAL
jgi:ATP-dependent DNA helicase RecG